MALLLAVLSQLCSVSIAFAEDEEPNQVEVAARREEKRFEELQPPMPQKLLSMWQQGALAYEQFQHEFHRSGGGPLSPIAKKALLEAATHLKALAGYTLGDQREFILHGRLQDIYMPLAREKEYCGEAASWSLQRALNPLGTNSFAVDEGSEATIWNAGVSGAIGYYRRAGDMARAEAALQVARKHPSAATKYERIDQTPLVFHPGVPSQPWWDPQSFSVVRKLEAAFENPITRADINAELDGLIQSNALQAIISPAAPLGTSQTVTETGSEECDRHDGSGAISAEGSSTSPSSTASDDDGGSWSEFPMFDGRAWSEQACAALPTLCQLLRSGADGSADPSICTAPASPAAPNLCGTSIVVTILRLSPGAAVLPHCGITNRRLTMQFALRGSDGVAFTVGGETRGYGGDGKAIVFDDSFEHSVQHRGAQVRYVLYAVLRHPNVTSGAYG